MNRFVLFFAAIFFAGNVLAEQVVTSTLANEAGIECPTTGVRVEAVEYNEALREQTLTISIPEELMRGSSIRLLTPDLQGLAFREFIESNRDYENGRRQYKLQMGKVGPFDFKIGFDSRQ